MASQGQVAVMNWFANSLIFFMFAVCLIDFRATGVWFDAEVRIEGVNLLVFVFLNAVSEGRRALFVLTLIFFLWFFVNGLSSLLELVVLSVYRKIYKDQAIRQHYAIALNFQVVSIAALVLYSSYSFLEAFEYISYQEINSIWDEKLQKIAGLWTLVFIFDIVFFLFLYIYKRASVKQAKKYLAARQAVERAYTEPIKEKEKEKTNIPAK